MPYRAFLSSLCISVTLSSTVAWLARPSPRAITRSDLKSSVTLTAAAADDEDDPFAGLMTQRNERREAIQKKALQLVLELEMGDEEDTETTETVEDVPVATVEAAVADAVVEAAVAANDEEIWSLTSEALDQSEDNEEFYEYENNDDDNYTDDDDNYPQFDALEEFRQLDKDFSGTLDLSEVLQGCKILGLSREQASRWFHELDADESGGIDVEEFLAAFVSKGTQALKTNKLFDKLFTIADADSSGGIDFKEFKGLYDLLDVMAGESAGEPADESFVASIFSAMDTDGSGTVELDELKTYMAGRVEVQWPELYEEISTWS